MSDEEEPRPRARCCVCGHWFFADTLAPLKQRDLRWNELICRGCLRAALNSIKGIKQPCIDGWKKGRNR